MSTHFRNPLDGRPLCSNAVGLPSLSSVRHSVDCKRCLKQWNTRQAIAAENTATCLRFRLVRDLLNTPFPASILHDLFFMTKGSATEFISLMTEFNLHLLLHSTHPENPFEMHLLDGETKLAVFKSHTPHGARVDVIVQICQLIAETYGG